MSVPLVSVILPVRDAASTLDAALESVARQRFRDFECLVVDDGSRDASRSIAATRAARDPRFRVIPRPGAGLVPALRSGVAAARGGLIARMDADDLMHRERLQAQVTGLAARPELAAIGCHVRLFPRRDLSEGRRAYEAWLNTIDSSETLARDAFIECPVAHPTLMMRREPLERLGYRDRDWPEDWDLVLRWLAAGEAIGVVPRRLHHWRDHPPRLSRTDPRYGLDRFTACRAAFLAEGPLRESPEYLLWGYGGTGKALARALRGHRRRPSHVVELHPGRLGQVIDGAPVVPPERLPDLPRQPLLVSVAGAGPRARIREALTAMGRLEGRDFFCAA